MNEQRLKSLLQQIRSREITVQAALEEIKHPSYDDLGFAKVDTHRHLRQTIPENPATPFQSAVRFKEIGGTRNSMAAMKDLGTYGVIKAPAGYILEAIKKGPFDLESFGYAMEALILSATRIGLGTCWLGGTFTKSVFARKMEVTPDETVPAVMAFGEIADKRRMTEKIIRWGARASKRKQWQSLFFDRSFGTHLDEKRAGAYRIPLEMVRIGPSGSNKQPWRIVRDFPYFHFYLQRTKGYYERNKRYFGMADMQRIDMGIAMCHFEHTCRALALNGEWIMEDPRIDGLPDLTTYVASYRAMEENAVSSVAI